MISKDATAGIAPFRSAAPHGAGGLAGSWVSPMDLEAQWWSPEMYEIYGVPSTFVPTPEAVLELIHPADRDRVRDARATWRSAGQSFAYPLRVIRPDGTPRTVHLSGRVDLDEEGVPLRAVGITRDITGEIGERPVDMVGRQQAMLLENASDGLCALDSWGRVVFANEALRELIGRAEETLEGRALHDLLHCDPHGRTEHPAGACRYACLLDGRVSGVDAELVRADGVPLTVEYAIATDGGVSVVSFRRALGAPAHESLLRRSEERVQTLLAQRDQLLHDVTAAEERERLRIAADLHDDTIQALRAVALELQSTRDELADPAARASLASAGTEVLAAATRLRQRMFDLMPPAVDDDLGGAVQAYCQLLFAGTEVSWEVIGDPGPLRPGSYVVAYRLLQEALRNVLRHAKARRARIELGAAHHTIVMRVLDDGIGWGADTPTAPINGGMRLIDERARSAGGWARPGPGLDGRGASVEFVLPRDGVERL